MTDLHMFDYSFLKAGTPQGVSLLLREISRLQARLAAQKQAYPAIYGALESAGRVRSLLSACRAGNTENRAAEICARNSPPITQKEKDMADYRDALFELEMGHPAVEPSCRDLLRLHSLVLARTPDAAGGRYREEPGCSPVPPEEIPEAVEVWEQALVSAYEEKGNAPLLLIPCLVADFICICPFSPGGRRMACLLTRLLLQRAGYALPVSWEEQVCRYEAFYAHALRQVREQQDYWPFIEVFLMLLYLCGCQAEKAFALLPGRKMTKKSRVEAVIAGSPVPISKGEICKLLPDVSPTTVEAALGELVKSGQALRRGSARTARYELA